MPSVASVLKLSGTNGVHVNATCPLPPRARVRFTTRPLPPRRASSVPRLPTRPYYGGDVYYAAVAVIHHVLAESAAAAVDAIEASVCDAQPVVLKSCPPRCPSGGPTGVVHQMSTFWKCAMHLAAAASTWAFIARRISDHQAVHTQRADLGRDLLELVLPSRLARMASPRALPLQGPGPSRGPVR